jgi:predicted RNA-binding Zn ribbon-like protein
MRAAVENADQLASAANQWIERYRIVPVVSGEELQLTGEATLAGQLARVVVEAIGNGIISRLKACPDCRWVFYDNTRNRKQKVVQDERRWP